jgi:hypothetical protein
MAEDAYYRLFESCDAAISRKVWLEELSLIIKKNKWCRQQKKQKDREAKETEESERNENQQATQNQGFCCHAHAVQWNRRRRRKKGNN